MSESIYSLYSHLDHLGLIYIRGPDCLKFLNGQITVDLNEVVENKYSPGAVCTPKGRVIANFIISKHLDGYFVVTLKSRVQDLVAHLKKYSVFFKVDITDDSESKFLLGSECPIENGRQYVGLNNRQILICDSIAQANEVCGTDIKDSSDWRKQDILDGIPWVDQESSEAFIPQHLNLQWIEGISFKKGCYTGQEIVTRMHYKGKLKRFMHLCQSDTRLTPGQKITNADKKVVAQVLNTHNNRILVVIEADAITSSLFLNNDEELNLEFSKLPYSDRIATEIRQ